MGSVYVILATLMISCIIVANPVHQSIPDVLSAAMVLSKIIPLIHPIPLILLTLPTPLTPLTHPTLLTPLTRPTRLFPLNSSHAWPASKGTTAKEELAPHVHKCPLGAITAVWMDWTVTIAMRAKIILAVCWEAAGVPVNFVTLRGVFCVVQVLLARSVILRISITWMRKLGYVLIVYHVNVVQWVKYRLLVSLNWSTRRRSAKRTSICRTSAYSSEFQVI